jgi:hypothetical protein
MRKNVIQYSKDPFLDLSGITRSTNKNHFFCKINDGKIVLSGSIDLWIGPETGSAQNCPVTFKILNLFCSWTKKKIIRKQIAPRQFGHYSDVDPVFWVGTGI